MCITHTQPRPHHTWQKYRGQDRPSDARSSNQRRCRHNFEGGLVLCARHCPCTVMVWTSVLPAVSAHGVLASQHRDFAFELHLHLEVARSQTQRDRESDGAFGRRSGVVVAYPAHTGRVDCSHVSPMASRGPPGPVKGGTSCSTAGSQPTIRPEREGSCSTPSIES